MPRPEGRNIEMEKRDAEIYEYYANLTSVAIGYTAAKAKEMTQQKFSYWNLSIRRISDIVGEQRLKIKSTATIHVNSLARAGAER